MPNEDISNPNRVLITGGSGFVGTWLRRELAGRSRIRPIVVAPHPDADGFDITDADAAEAAVREFRPDSVIHLAAIAAPAEARDAPRKAWAVNLGGTQNVAEAVLRHAPKARFVFIGSSESYGASFASQTGTVREDMSLQPLNTYGATKAAADICIGQMSHDGLKAIRFRPFNHTGPGQSDTYVVAAFARQIAGIVSNGAPRVVDVGNLDAKRDFLDVRDVVRAYADAALSDIEIVPGLVFNLASGHARSIRSILEDLIAASGVEVDIRIDPARVRPLDIPRAEGDARAAKSYLGWEPKITWPETVRDILEDWSLRVAGQ